MPGRWYCRWAWPVAQAFRKRNSAFNDSHRRMVWLARRGLMGELLAFGRFAPFYQYFYLLRWHPRSATREVLPRF